MGRNPTPPEKTRYGRCEAYARSAARRCGRAAIGEHGKCGYHGGKTDSGGPPKGSANAKTHGLYMATETYIDKQSEEDRAIIYEITESLADMWASRHGGRPPLAIRNRLEALAIDMHKSGVASGYFAERGLTEEREALVDGEVISTERVNLWASELRRLDSAIESRLDRHGLLDPPEDRTAGPQPGDVFASEHVEITFVGDAEESDDE